MSTQSAGRGPGYPFLDLPMAVEKAREMYSYAKRSEVDAAGLVKHWGYTAKSSSGTKSVAALKYFGLIEERRVSNQRRLRLTDRAYRILVDHEESAERLQALKDAALAPRQYKYCWDTWGRDMPSDDAMRSHLIFNRGFVESSAGPFLRDYKSSIQFAGLLDGPARKEDETKRDDGVKIGDYVQWESQGVWQFQEPRRVIALEADGYALVEGSQTGIPVAELAQVDPPEIKTPKPNVPKPAVKREPGMKQDTFTLSEGDVVLTWPAAISEASFQDLQDWLELMRRKIQRAVSSAEDTPTEGSED